MSWIYDLLRLKAEGVRHVVEHAHHVEENHKDIKCELENIKKRIDPLKDMLLDMERVFREKNGAG